MHEPVLKNQVVELLGIGRGDAWIDGTVGGGGHASAILHATNDCFVLGIDRDPAAVVRAQERLACYGSRCRVVHGNFADMSAIAKREGISEAAGVLLDLGISSEQLGMENRGFSFMKDGPLDMRMDPTGQKTAEDLVNGAPEDDLERIIRMYGEEQHSRKIAAVIVEARVKNRIETTSQLADLVCKCVRRIGHIHPATRVFQALRIAVNNELECLAKGLDEGLKVLKPGGRMAVISFHSLEDRMMKQFAVSHRGRWESLQQGGREWRGTYPQVSILTKRPVTASKDEIRNNPRSRSAKLRVIERITAFQNTIMETTHGAQK
ncbi:MAG: 16S rRNA (cytosine(1402)-N(4))-methyltransferase RsmH [Lentisphaerae bacterium]|nr:16S rRNA (cytosine(1402)-N(4))-methyltransferase RsmH [Lentisphaerota bacterium]